MFYKQNQKYRQCNLGWLGEALDARPALKISILPLAGLLAGAFIGCLSDRDSLATLSLHLLTVPVLFLIWLKINDNITLSFSRSACIASLTGYLAAFVFTGGFWEITGMWVGTLAGLCVFVPFAQLRRQVRNQRQRAAVAAIGALSGPLYGLAHTYMWKAAATAIVQTLYFLLHPWFSYLAIFERGHRVAYSVIAHPHAHAPHRHHWHLVRHTAHKLVHFLRPFSPHAPKPHSVVPDYIALVSKHFTLKFPPEGNMCDGLFLLVFLLSVVMVIDWRNFYPRRVWLTYIMGVPYIFLTNLLAMAALFLLGDRLAVSHPENMLPMLLSQGWIGWVGYAAASVLFIALLYKFYKAPSFYKTYLRS